MRFALNDASVVANQFGNQCKTQTRALGFRRHEWIEQIAKDLGRNARPIIPNADLERQRDRFGAWRRAQAHSWTIRGGEGYLALNAIFPNGFSGVLYQVEKHLDELIARSQHVRKRRIIGLDEADMAREPGLSQTLDVVQYGVNVEAFPLGWR